MKSTNSYIFFREDFSRNLMMLIPDIVMKYWEIDIHDKKEITGYVRYNNTDIDAIYLNLQTKFGKLNSDIRLCVVKFNLIEGSFIYDSIYSTYDPINDVILYPLKEFRYDNEMNVIAEYHTIRNRVIYLDDDGIPTEKSSVQYKYGKRLKEYIVSKVQVPVTLINDLRKIKAVHGKFNKNSMMCRVKLIDDNTCIYYNISR